MTETALNPPAPPFWSADFHFRFFPRLLWTQIRNHPDSRKRHVLIEIPIAVVVCGLFIALGLPSAIDRHSIGGWGMTVLGAGGLIALLVVCLRGTAGSILDYSEFEPWTFLFLTATGIAGGFMGGGQLGSFWLQGLGILVGLTIGYLTGIAGGLWIQRLGPLRVFIALAAGLGFFVIVGTSFIYFLYIQK